MTPPDSDSGTRFTCADPSCDILHESKPDSDAREVRCPTADEAVRFEFLDATQPVCSRCLRRHIPAPRVDPEVFLPHHLAQRILAALESMQHHASGTEFRALAAELRALLVTHG